MSSISLLRLRAMAARWSGLGPFLVLRMCAISKIVYRVLGMMVAVHTNGLHCNCRMKEMVHLESL